MKIDNWSSALPGGTLVAAGLKDFQNQRCTVAACLVTMARPRLTRAGLIAETTPVFIPEPERQLYQLLLAEGADAYSRYNSLVRELVSFEQALDRKNLGTWMAEREMERPVAPGGSK